MNRICYIGVLLILVSGTLAVQTFETVPFGDFESWTVRHIRESGSRGASVGSVGNVLWVTM